MIDPSIIDQQLNEARDAVEQQKIWLQQWFDRQRVADPYSPSTWMLVDQTLREYVDAVAKVAILEFVKGPHFYAALMRSAAEQDEQP